MDKEFEELIRLVEHWLNVHDDLVSYSYGQVDPIVIYSVLAVPERAGAAPIEIGFDSSCGVYFSVGKGISYSPDEDLQGVYVDNKSFVLDVLNTVLEGDVRMVEYFYRGRVCGYSGVVSLKKNKPYSYIYIDSIFKYYISKYLLKNYKVTDYVSWVKEPTNIWGQSKKYLNIWGQSKNSSKRSKENN